MSAGGVTLSGHMAGTLSKAIQINPANRGKLRATAGAKKGKKIPAGELQKLAGSSNPVTRKRAQFAINARKFKHA